MKLLVKYQIRENTSFNCRLIARMSRRVSEKLISTIYSVFLEQNEITIAFQITDCVHIICI